MLESYYDIKKWMKEHDTHNMTSKQIAKAIVIEAINNTHWDEDNFPHIKENLLKHIEEYDDDSF